MRILIWHSSCCLLSVERIKNILTQIWRHLSHAKNVSALVCSSA